MQNKLTQATPELPVEVQEQGMIVAKAESDFILVVALYDTDGRHDTTDLGDYLRASWSIPFRGSTASATPRYSARNMPCVSGSIPTSSTITS